MIEYVLHKGLFMAVISLMGAMIYCVGIRASLTKSEWLATKNRYLKVFAVEVMLALIILYFPVIIKLPVYPQMKALFNPLAIILAMFTALMAAKIFTGLVMCIGGPRGLRARKQNDEATKHS